MARSNQAPRNSFGASASTTQTLQIVPATMSSESGIQFAITTFNLIVASADTKRKSSDAPEMRSICPLSTSRSLRSIRAPTCSNTPPIMHNGKSGKPCIGMSFRNP